MAALPYMQLYIADYLADTMHLETDEHGAYLLLIFNYWQTGKPIPKNRLRAITKLSNERWTVVEQSLNEYFNDTGTHWQHIRIDADLRMVEESQAQRSKAGKASAEARKRNAQKEQKAATKPSANEQSTTVEHPLNGCSNDRSTNKEQNRIDKNRTDKVKTYADSHANAAAIEQPPDPPPDPPPESKPASKPEPQPAGQWTALFDRFWDAFDLKSGKSGALKSWKAIPKRDRNLESILAAAHAEAQRRKLQPDKKPKWAQGWLSEQRWLDEIYSQPVASSPAISQAERIAARRREREPRVVNQ